MTTSPLFLIGFMGAGKSAIGRLLADALHREFIDLDFYIEQRFHCTINHLFTERGEAFFREIEGRLLREAAEFENIVISTGGGAPCHAGNMEAMNRRGVTIFIDPSEETLFERLKRGMEKRPLLRGKSDQELREFIHAKLSERRSVYEQAHVKVDEEESKQQLVERILLQLNNHIKCPASPLCGSGLSAEHNV